LKKLFAGPPVKAEIQPSLPFFEQSGK